MAKFTYTAMDAKGGEKSGTLDAETQNVAVNKLREMGLFPTNVIEADSGKKEAKSTAPARKIPARTGVKGPSALNINLSALWGGSGVKTKTLTLFTRQLATLVDAGLPLLRGLSVLMRQERNPVLRAILADLSSSV